MNKKTKTTINIVTILSIIIWIIDTQINVLQNLGLTENGVKWVKLIGAVALVYLNAIKPTNLESKDGSGVKPPIGGGGGTPPPKP